jgi:hypothetical protein
LLIALAVLVAALITRAMLRRRRRAATQAGPMPDLRDAPGTRKGPDARKAKKW